MKRPLVFAVATCTAGAVCGFYLQSVIAALLIATAVFGIGCFALKKRFWIFLLAVGFFAAGLLPTAAYLYTRPQLLGNGPIYLEGEVVSVPRGGSEYDHAVLKSEKFGFKKITGGTEEVSVPLYFNLYIKSGTTDYSIGDRILVLGKFRSEDSRSRVCGTVTAERTELLEGGRNWFTEFAHNCSEKTSRFILKRFPGQEGAVLNAIMTGDRSQLSKETTEAFKRAGISHLIAVSGMHISLFLFLFTCLTFFFPRRWRLVLSLPVLGFLVVFTGASPSVLRAATMSSVFLVADALGRDSDGLTSLFFSGAVLMLLDFDVVYDVSFQLSFSAVLGLVLGMPLLTHPFFERWYGKVIGASVMAQLGSLPVAIGAFGTLYPYALLTNVLVVPLFPILVTVCLLAAPLAFLLPGAKGLLTGFIWLATAVGKLPAAEVGIGAISGEVAVFIGCGLAVAYLLLQRQKE